MAVDHGASYKYIAGEIGDLYAMRGEFFEAIQWYEKYLEVAPDYYIDEYKEKLQKLKYER